MKRQLKYGKNTIGCPGSGKSTFARKLRDITGLPLYYLDRLWHRPDRTTVSTDVFDAALLKILLQGCWIIDGDFGRTMPLRLQYCDTVFLLDYPIEVCLEGARSRYGFPREDMPWVERPDEEFGCFLQSIQAFKEQKIPGIYALLDSFRTSTDIYCFHVREEANAYLQQLAEKSCV